MLVIKRKRNISLIFTLGFLMNLPLCNNFAMAMEYEDEYGETSRSRSPTRTERQRFSRYESRKSITEETFSITKISQENEKVSKMRTSTEQDYTLTDSEVKIIQNTHLKEKEDLRKIIKTLTSENSSLKIKLDESNNRWCSCFYILKSAFLKFFEYKEM